MVDSTTTLSLSRQCRLLQIGRTSIYYYPCISEAKQALMRQVDELYTEDPTRGTRRICAALQRRGVKIARGKARKIMQMLGLAGIYRKPNLSKALASHKKYPYLLRNVKIMRVNQVWSTSHSTTAFRQKCISHRARSAKPLHNTEYGDHLSIARKTVKKSLPLHF
jgi:putative transposase